MTREEAEAAALRMCLIAGNHLGTHKAAHWPPSDADNDQARDLISTHGVKEYDMWVAWSLIMRASRLLRGADVIALPASTKP